MLVSFRHRGFMRAPHISEVRPESIYSETSESQIQTLDFFLEVKACHMLTNHRLSEIRASDR